MNKYTEVLSAMLLLASTMNVVNNVSASASGGQASASVHIEQTVNGVAEPPVDIATTTASGSVDLHVRSTVIANGSSVVATSEVTTSGGATSEILPEVTTGTAATATPAATASGGLFAGLGGFFAHLFGWFSFKW